jgi:hypothetical protein
MISGSTATSAAALSGEKSIVKIEMQEEQSQKS